MAARKTKPPGRPKGAVNKLSGSTKENIVAVFTRLGGTNGMAKWAKKNQGEFYRIYARLLPIEVDANLSGGIIVVKERDPTIRPPGYQRKTMHQRPDEALRNNK